MKKEKNIILLPLSESLFYIHFLGLVGLIGEFLLLLVILLLDTSTQILNPVINYISEYANSPFSTLLRISLIIHGIGMVAIATGLAISLPKSRSRKLAVAFLGAAAIGTILGGVFSTDSPGIIRSVTGIIHQITALAFFPLEVGAVIFFSYVFRNTPSWNSFTTITVLIAVIGIIFSLWLVISIIIGGLPGLAERAVFFIFFLWEILIAIRLLTYKVTTQT